MNQSAEQSAVSGNYFNGDQHVMQTELSDNKKTTGLSVFQVHHFAEELLLVGKLEL